MAKAGKRKAAVPSRQRQEIGESEEFRTGLHRNGSIKLMLM